MNRKNEALRWFKEAEEELITARADFRAKRFSACCFWAQQSVEKALKSFAFLKGENMLFEHLLERIIERCMKYNDKFGKFKENARKLDKYYIPTRYPNGLPFPAVPSTYFSKNEAKEAIKVATEIIIFVKSKLKNDT